MAYEVIGGDAKSTAVTAVAMLAETLNLLTATQSVTTAVSAASTAKAIFEASHPPNPIGNARISGNSGSCGLIRCPESFKSMVC